MFWRKHGFRFYGKFPFGFVFCGPKFGFPTKSEYLKMLEEYKKELQDELKEVEKEIKKLKQEK